MNKHQPLYAIEIGDSELGLIGYLCIDSLVRGVSHGGIRITQDLSLDELKQLSRTMSYKSAFIGLEFGGAKSGIILRDRRKRKEYLEAFGRAIAPFIRKGLYIPGTDMGCSNKDMELIMTAAGRAYDKNKPEGKSHIYTGWGVGVAAEEAMLLQGIDIKGATVAIEGFGKVGLNAAKWLFDKGAKIIAISTRSGAIYEKTGLDILRVIELTEKYGDDALLHYSGAKRIKIPELLEKKMDVLVPCAGSCSINEGNYAKIEARIVCPGSNHPMDDEIERKLHQHGIFVYPDYVSNCCGILGSWLDNEQSQDSLRKLINSVYRSKIKDLLALTGKRGYVRDITDKVVQARINKKGYSAKSLSSLGFNAGRKMLPRFVKSKIFSIRLIRRFKKISFCKP